VKKIELPRRRFVEIVIIAAHGEIFAQSPLATEKPLPRTKRQFMELAITDIKNINSKAEQERKAAIAAGQGAPLFNRLANVVPFGDWDYYFIDGDLSYSPPVSSKLDTVVVPKGFVSDLASVPSFLWGIYPPTGRYAYAAIVHDYLYWMQTSSKADADRIIELAMLDSKVSPGDASRFYDAVNLLGARAWAKNAEAKKQGEKRVLSTLPTTEQRLISWSEWKARPNALKN
jgi:hypothetical protein